MCVCVCLLTSVVNICVGSHNETNARCNVSERDRPTREALELVTVLSAGALGDFFGRGRSKTWIQD